MNSNTLKEFRHEAYQCFKRASDALWNVVDALSSETTAHSFPELSLSPLFERKWPSLYEAFEDGCIDQDRLRESFVEFAPLPSPGETVFLGIDASHLYRPEARTAADLTMVLVTNLPEEARVVSPGWVISSVVLLPTQPGQATFVLDVARVTSQELETEVAARQLKAVVALLTQRSLRPVVLGDRWYACAPFLARMTDVAASCLLRVKRNRVFYRRAPARTPGQRGAGRKDGARFQCSDEATHGEPDARWEGSDHTGKRVEVRCWNQLHLRTARFVEVSVIQVIREGASGRPRDPKVSWFVWRGWQNEAAPLAQMSPTYRLRYSHEHGYRLDKQVLMWDRPRLRTPAQTLRWSQVVACAHNQLVLARPLVEATYRPWETRRSVLTLTQVRRSMTSFLRQLGTPARPPQPRGKSPGRAKGFHPVPAPRYQVVLKTSNTEKKRKTASSA